MRAIFETSFDILYLVSVITLGIIIIKNSKGNKEYLLFGIMSVVLGAGDAFHLIPRAYALCTTGLSDYTVALGIGKLVTSITMTVFYVLLYFVWRIRYKIKGKNGITFTMLFLAIIRIVLCFFPQNAWTSQNAPLSWGIYRNIPFAVMGILIILLFYFESKRKKDTEYRFMWVTVTLSFAFYIPVVIFAKAMPILGMFMIPKILAYFWIVWIGYSDMKK